MIGANPGRPDNVLFIVAVVFVLLGILMVFNASTGVGKRLFNDPDHFFKKQLIYGIFGIGCLILLIFVPYQRIERLANPLLLVSLVLLLLVLIPGIGRVANNARRWLVFGPFAFQPSELAKLAILLYLSRLLARKRERGVTDALRGFLPPLLVLGLFFILIFMQPDFSTAVILVFAGLLMFFAGGVPLGHLLGLGLTGIPLVLMLVFSRDYMRARLFAHLDPLSDASRQGYQVVQSLLSFQKGGLFGNGPGKGVQKLGALPESHTDFLLAAHAEEIGFFGCALIVLLLFVFFQRMLKIALHAPDDFSRLFSYGAAMLIGWQGLVNVAMVSGLIPATGLPFPFLSSGGSSLLVFCLMTGIVLNISRRTQDSPARSGNAMMGVA